VFRDLRILRSCRHPDGDRVRVYSFGIGVSKSIVHSVYLENTAYIKSGLHDRDVKVAPRAFDNSFVFRIGS
jgi:hypothetical protein